jgi:transcriptional regulator with XRE-family HTH domain
MTIQHDHEGVPPLTLPWRMQMAIAHGQVKHSQLMEKFEVSRETVSRWCNGHGAPPKKFILNEIAVMCGVSPRWLIDGTTADDNPTGGGQSAAPIPDESPLSGLNRRPFAYKRRCRPARIGDKAA